MEYRHLSDRDMRKMKSRKKVAWYLKKSMRWTFSAAILATVFVVGAVAFYVTVDSKEKFHPIEDNSLSVERENVDVSINKDKEFEKSLERAELIDEIEQKGEQSDVSKESKEMENGGFSEWNKNCPPELIVVNGKNSIDESHKVDIKVCRGKEIGALAAEKLEEMIQSASKEGIILWISSGYRSTKYQEKLFNNQVQREKAKGNSQEKAEELAQTVVARPGTSEHNTGLAVDFNGVQDDFYKTKEYKWLMDNAERFGFIERYQEKWRDRTGVIYEPWHFRYVGSYAPAIKESNLCLEDYIKQNLM